MPATKWLLFKACIAHRQSFSPLPSPMVDQSRCNTKPSDFRRNPAWLLLFTLISVVLAVPSKVAADSLAIEPGNSYQNLGKWIDYLEVPGEVTDIDVAQAQHKQGQFSDLPGRDPNFGMSRSSFWLTFDITNAGNTAGNWVLSLGIPYIRLLNVYVERDGISELILSDGSSIAYSQRTTSHRIIATPELELSGHETVSVWIQFSSDLVSRLVLTLEPPGDHFSRTLKGEVSLAVYYSVAVVMAILIAIVALILRKRVALLYAGYFISLLLFTAQANGHLFVHLWPDYPQFNAVIAHPLSLAMLFFLVLFGYQFIAFEKAPRFAKILTLAAVASVLICAVVTLIWDVFTARKMIAAMSLFLLLVQTINAVVAFRSGRHGSGYFLVATLVLVGFLGMFVVLTMYVPASNNADLYAYLRYGQLIDGAIYSTAVIQLAMALRKSEQSAVAKVSELDLELSRTHHDVRQPLMALKSALSSLENEPSSGDTKTYHRVAQSVHYLENLLTRDTVGDNSGSCGIESEQGHNTADTTGADIVDSIIIMFSDDAKKRNIQLSREGDSGTSLPGSVSLLRVIANLVSNAVAHSQAENVRVIVRDEDESPEILVTDDGVGVPESIANTFAGNVSSACATSGLGLGIVRKICEDNGWSVRLDTGRTGSTFCIGFNSARLQKPV